MDRNGLKFLDCARVKGRLPRHSSSGEFFAVALVLILRSHEAKLRVNFPGWDNHIEEKFPLFCSLCSPSKAAPKQKQQSSSPFAVALL